MIQCIVTQCNFSYQRSGSRVTSAAHDARLASAVDGSRDVKVPSFKNGSAYPAPTAKKQESRYPPQ